MKVKDLIARLSACNPEQEIMVMDSENGQGYARTINFGPVQHKINSNDAWYCADCEDHEGKRVVVLGYGCY